MHAIKELIAHIISLLVLCAITAAQPFTYRNFTVEDGLPSNETYQVFEDSKGYIWIATDRGVSRYNGYEFENFTTADGLPDNTIFEFYEDYKGRIWFHTFNGTIGYYFKDQFITPKQSKIGHRYIRFIKVLPNDTLLIKAYSSTSIYAYKIISPTKIERINQDFTPDDLSNMFTSKTAKVVNKKLKMSSDAVGSLRIQNIKGKLIDVINSETIKISAISKHNKEIYLSCTSGHIIKYPDNTNLTVSDTFEFPGWQITYYHIDRNSGEWVSTLNNGIYYKPKTSVKLLNADNEFGTRSYSHYYKNANFEIFIDLNNRVYSKRNGQIKHIYSGSTTFPKIYHYNNKICLSESNEITIIDRHNNITNYPVEGYFKPLYLTEKDKLIAAGSRDDVYYGSINSSQQKMEIDTSFSINNRRVSVVKNNKNTLWLGGMDGVNLLDINSLEFIDNKVNTIDERVEDIEFINNEIAVLATRGAGVLIYYNDSIYNINKSNGLTNNLINNIIIDSEQNIWISTHSGLSKIRITSFTPFRYEIYNFGIEDGLPSKQINRLHIYNDTIYAVTNSGIGYFYKDDIGNSMIPNITIDKIHVNGTLQSMPTTRLQLSPKQKNIDINFSSLYYANPTSLIYKYRLLGIQDTTWTKTNYRKASFLSLPSGSYTFQVKAITPKGIESNHAAQFSFNISTPLLLRWYMILAELLILILIIYFYFNRRFRRLQQEVKLKNELFKLENKALASQMNPHFLFNSITAVQNYILKEDKYKAYGYLNKFSVLVRSVLQNSERQMISLQEELDLLKIYLELEQMRFQDKFDFSIKVNVDDYTHYQIPGLIIQPYAENAIRHGLLHKKEKGKLTISINRKSAFFEIVIEDNGVGRQRSLAINNEKKKQHKSLAMNISKRRLEIINNVYKSDLSVEIEDLYENDTPVGTKVKLYIPVKPND